MENTTSGKTRKEEQEMPIGGVHEVTWLDWGIAIATSVLLLIGLPIALYVWRNKDK